MKVIILCTGINDGILQDVITQNLNIRYECFLFLLCSLTPYSYLKRAVVLSKNIRVYHGINNGILQDVTTQNLSIRYV